MWYNMVNYHILIMGRIVLKWKKDFLEQLDNNIKCKRQEKLEIDNELNDLESQKKDYGLNKYLDKNFRLSILNNAENLGYSKTDIQRMKYYVEEWNQDNVTIEVIDNFRNIESFIKQYEPASNKSTLYKIGLFIKNEGGNSNENWHYNSKRLLI